MVRQRLVELERHGVQEVILSRRSLASSPGVWSDRMIWQTKNIRTLFRQDQTCSYWVLLGNWFRALTQARIVR